MVNDGATQNTNVPARATREAAEAAMSLAVGRVEVSSLCLTDLMLVCNYVFVGVHDIDAHY